MVDGSVIQAVAESGLGLWDRIKSQCLDSNPFIEVDEEGIEHITCPRCMRSGPSMTFKTLGIEPRAVLWSSPVQKCAYCSHLFAFVR